MDTGRLPEMDGQAPKGREPAPLPGGSEGSAGGSISPGDSKVNDGKAAFVSGDVVAFKYQGTVWRYTVVSIHEFQQAVTIENGIGTAICHPTEIRPWAEYEAELFLEKAIKYQRQYDQAISLWNAGHTTAAKLATALGILPMNAGRIVVTLKKYKLIEDPELCHAPE